jgi:hypothetical protein
VRRRATAQPWRGVSYIERLSDTRDIAVEEGTEEDSSEMIDRLLREMRQNRQTLAPVRERERDQVRELEERAGRKSWKKETEN